MSVKSSSRRSPSLTLAKPKPLVTFRDRVVDFYKNRAPNRVTQLQSVPFQVTARDVDLSAFVEPPSVYRESLVWGYDVSHNMSVSTMSEESEEDPWADACAPQVASEGDDVTANSLRWTSIGTSNAGNEIHAQSSSSHLVSAEPPKPTVSIREISSQGDEFNDEVEYEYEEVEEEEEAEEAPGA